MGKRAALLLLLVAACRSADVWGAGGLSALPQVGLCAGAGAVVRKNEAQELSAEVEGAFQFLDDKDFNDDGLTGPGDLSQLRIGMRHLLNPGAKRHLTFHYGAVWFHATGTPLIVDEPGDYMGAYAGIGFETDLSPRWRMGPDFRLLLVDGPSGVSVVPQFGWVVKFKF